jgi:hypothetical protein
MKMTRATILLLVLAATFLIGGILEPFLPHPGQPFNEASAIHSFVIAVLVFAWCKAHAAQRNTAPPSGSVLVAAILPPIGVPLYFFRSMPWRQASIATLKAIGYLFVVAALFQGGYYVGYQFVA